MSTDQLVQIVDQIQRLWEIHVPATYHVPLYPVAVGMLLIGIGSSVLGAKLARFGITCGLGGLGALIGGALAPEIDWPSIAVTLVGATVGAGLGYGLFRLWVGLAAATFLAAVTVGAYGSQVVLPHFLEYEPLSSFDGSFTLPDTEEGESGDDALSDIKAHAHDFWLYVQSQETDVNRKIQGVGLVAALAGLLLGSILPRFTLIVTSSLVGTVLVMSGLAGLGTQFGVDVTRAVEQHGQIVGTAALVFLFASLLLQTLLTRKAHPSVQTRPSS